MAQDFNLFLSYSRKDLEHVKVIKDDLEQATGVHCWMDLDGIESGEQFANVIISAINRSDTLLFMMSEASMKSEWALDELDFAKRKRKRIVLVAIDDVEMTDKFYFHYHKYDIIDWKNVAQRQKLIRNILNWKSGKATKEESKLKSEDVPQATKEESKPKSEDVPQAGQPILVPLKRIKQIRGISIKKIVEKPMFWVASVLVLLIVPLILFMSGRTSAPQEKQEGVLETDTFDFSGAYAPWPSDSMAVDDEDDSENRSWEQIPYTQKAMPLNFEKWLTMMNYIRDNYWKRPTRQMLADIGLEALYERDTMDEDSIKDVHFIYGRQTKCVTDSTGEKYHTYNGSHAVIFDVSAYTSSGAEILFHNPVDLKNFMEQAINRGIACHRNGTYVVCDKPMGDGIHKVKEVYDHREIDRGAYKELYYLNPVYEPGAEWQSCYISLDFLRHRIDVE